MENVMNILKETINKVKDFLENLGNNATETAAELWGEVNDKAMKPLCKKARSLCRGGKKAVSDHREAVLLGAAICSGVIAAVSCVGYLLHRKK